MMISNGFLKMSVSGNLQTRSRIWLLGGEKKSEKLENMG